MKKKYYYKHVYDPEYARAYYRKNKKKVRAWTKKWTDKNKKHCNEYARNWCERNKERLKLLRSTPERKKKIASWSHKFYLKEKGTERFKKRNLKNHALYKERHPLKYKLHKRLSVIRQRCKNKKYKDYRWYGGRGIKCFLSTKDLLEIWFRDNAEMMKKPSVDRINNDGNYTLENCRFIESIENLKRRYA